MLQKIIYSILVFCLQKFLFLCFFNFQNFFLTNLLWYYGTKGQAHPFPYPHSTSSLIHPHYAFVNANMGAFSHGLLVVVSTFACGSPYHNFSNIICISHLLCLLCGYSNTWACLNINEGCFTPRSRANPLRKRLETLTCDWPKG